MRGLIVNADDFGKSPHTVEWTIRGFELGVLNSATIMAHTTATDDAVNYALAHPQFSFGMHLYLTDLPPVAQGASTMVNPKTGCLWGVRDLLIRSTLGLIRKDDIKREILAQHRSLKATGLAISHLDGHGHMHRIPAVLNALIELQEVMGVCKMRRCQDIYYRPAGMMARIFNNHQNKKLKAHFLTTDHFLMTSGKIGADCDWFDRSLQRLPEGVTEIGIHPGDDKLWRKIDTEGPFAQKDWHGLARMNYNQLGDGNV